MTKRIVYLFPDTNLFIQCKSLEELDWFAWKDCDEVRLIVSKPVLREIDHLKKKGDRVGKRSRAVSAIFRKIINSGGDHKLVRASGPCVKLSVETQHDYSDALKDRLNYAERDDQLLGTIHQFAERNPDAEVRLLTHDTTPMYTARGLGVLYTSIPEDWLLPSENTETEKQIASLNAEIARLQKAEPSFEVRCLNSEREEVEQYEASYTWFKPLTDAEIDSLMQRLKDRFPLETDFGSREPAEREVSRTAIQIPGIKQVFIPVTDEEIAKYRDEAYPQWADRCAQIFRDLHDTLQRDTPMPALAFLARNTGTRPAKDALITLEAEGKFAIRPPARDDGDDDDEAEREKTVRSVDLPPPPAPPRGEWQMSTAHDFGRSFRQLAELQRSLDSLPAMTGYLAGGLDRSLRLPIIHPTPHDPNGFYYKPIRPRIPRSTFSLECDQWRHDDGEKEFLAEIFVPADQDSVRGALICRIQAENLSHSADKLIPVRITISHVSAVERAAKLIDSLISHS